MDVRQALKSIRLLANAAESDDLDLVREQIDMIITPTLKPPPSGCHGEQAWFRSFEGTQRRTRHDICDVRAPPERMVPRAGRPQDGLAPRLEGAIQTQAQKLSSGISSRQIECQSVQ
jgi:hypothetical protein